MTSQVLLMCQLYTYYNVKLIFDFTIKFVIAVDWKNAQSSFFFFVNIT